MIMWEKMKELSFKFFGKKLEGTEKYFDSIRQDISMADMGLSLMEYVYIVFFSMLMIFIIEFPLIVIITTLVMKSALTAIMVSLTTTFFIEIGMFFIFYTYPSHVSNKRKKNIEAALPFATTYMATIASSGAPPSTMFRLLSRFKEYGDIANEAEKVNKDVELFGMDLLASIKKLAERTPSAQFRELLWGLDTVIRAGGNLTDFLHEKSATFMNEYQRKLKAYSDTLSLLIEVYLTVILVGSIFFIIMSALMSIFGAGTMNLFMSFMQFVVIFIGLPVASIGFILILKRISPGV